MISMKKQFIAPDTASIYSQRRYHEMALRRMFREGAVLKDGHGYYIHEVNIEPQNAHDSPKKVYFEDTFQRLEERILHRYKEAEKLAARMSAEKKQKLRFQHYRTWMRIDYELIFLTAVYSGSEGYPFLSINQVDQLLQEKLALGVVAEVLIERKDSPLHSIRRMEEFLGKKYTLKQLQSKAEPGFFRRHKPEEYYLYTMPYGANREKRDHLRT